MQIYKTENEFGAGEVRSWASLIDDNCLNQATKISRVPILEGYLALMPDAHHGYGPPVGSALLTRDAVMPYAVGVDIGCGMIAAETDMDRDRLRGHEGRILAGIRTAVPSGVGHSFSTPTGFSDSFFGQYGLPRGLKLCHSIHAEETARIQFGTLGAGNHFVEVCEDLVGKVWIVLHSGSRGIGNQLATAHVRIAKEFHEEGTLEDKDFAWFHRWQPEYEAYLSDMVWAQEYAFAQREAMMEATLAAVSDGARVSFEILRKVNCHHNYAEELEDGLWLTRKGAIDASEGVYGVIPGSMGAATYIVRGRGNAEAYNTSPHGAGRLLGRNAAKREIDLETFKAQMAGKTWLDRDAAKLLDEAPFAYKPIETVIEDSSTLVEPVTLLNQFINYKGL